MATGIDDCKLVYINSNGDVVGIFKAEWDAPAFIDYGDYLLPLDFLRVY
jgi:uncharacterized protein YuzE